MKRSERTTSSATARTGSGLMAALALLSGCFDVDESEVEIVSPEVRRIDDFDDGDRWPSWEALWYWHCFSYPGGQWEHCDHDESGTAVALDFTLESHSYAGALLQIEVAGPPLDLTPYDQFVFRAKLELAEPLPPDPEVRAEFSCEGIAEVGTSPSGEPLRVASAVWPTPGAGWTTFAFDLERFRQPEWQTEPVTGWAEPIDPRECLAHVQSLAFEITRKGEPPHAMSGTLGLDDIELYTYDELRLERGLRFSPWECLAINGRGSAECAVDDPPSMVFQVADDLDTSSPPWVALCTYPLAIESTDHVMTRGSVDLRSEASLRFRARYAPSSKLADADVPFRIRLGCENYARSALWAAVTRNVDISPTWSTYTLPLSSFALTPLGFDDEQGCLAHVDRICVETAPADGGSLEGTLSVDALVVLR